MIATAPRAHDRVDAALHHAVAAPDHREVGLDGEAPCGPSRGLPALGHLVPPQLLDVFLGDQPAQFVEAAAECLAACATTATRRAVIAVTIASRRDARAACLGRRSSRSAFGRIRTYVADAHNATKIRLPSTSVGWCSPRYNRDTITVVGSTTAGTSISHRHHPLLRPMTRIAVAMQMHSIAATCPDGYANVGRCGSSCATSGRGRRTTAAPTRNPPSSPIMSVATNMTGRQRRSTASATTHVAIDAMSIACVAPIVLPTELHAVNVGVRRVPNHRGMVRSPSTLPLPNLTMSSPTPMTIPTMRTHAITTPAAAAPGCPCFLRAPVPPARVARRDSWLEPFGDRIGDRLAPATARDLERVRGEAEPCDTERPTAHHVGQVVHAEHESAESDQPDQCSGQHFRECSKSGRHRGQERQQHGAVTNHRPERVSTGKAASGAVRDRVLDDRPQPSDQGFEDGIQHQGAGTGDRHVQREPVQMTYCEDHDGCDNDGPQHAAAAGLSRRGFISADLGRGCRSHRRQGVGSNPATTLRHVDLIDNENSLKSNMRCCQ